jgi:hypothetical protein
VDIDNATYYFDPIAGFYRDEAKVACDARNMTLVSFENDNQKWISISKFILVNGKLLKSLHKQSISNYLHPTKVTMASTFGTTRSETKALQKMLGTGNPQEIKSQMRIFTGELLSQIRRIPKGALASSSTPTHLMTLFAQIPLLDTFANIT